jgi:hypothetical protein
MARTGATHSRRYLDWVRAAQVHLFGRRGVLRMCAEYRGRNAMDNPRFGQVLSFRKKTSSSGTSK